MDESAIKILLDSLDKSRSSLDWWLSFWTWWVAIGVPLEAISVIWEYVDDLRDFRHGTIHSPERPSRMLLAFGLFGVALVAIGVTGELRVESKIGAVETSIRKANDERAQLLSKEAGDAKTSADAAVSDAERAKKQADAVGKQANELSGQLTTARAQLLAAQENLRKEEKEAEDLQSLVNQLVLSALQVPPLKLDLSEILRDFPRSTIIVQYQGVNASSRFLAKTLVLLFKNQLHWEVADVPLPNPRFEIPHFPQRGVTIFNKWASSAVIVTQPIDMTPDGRILTSPNGTFQALKAKGLSDTDAGILADLAVALDATIEKDTTLPEGTFVIAISDLSR